MLKGLVKQGEGRYRSRQRQERGPVKRQTQPAFLFKKVKTTVSTPERGQGKNGRSASAEKEGILKVEERERCSNTCTNNPWCRRGAQTTAEENHLKVGVK